MAFTTTQTTDSILLRGLNFRTPANAAISSQYSLYANGAGQTYWSNSVSPTNLSSLSTAIGQNYSSITSVLQFQSTTIASADTSHLSTSAGLALIDGNFSNSIYLLSTNTAAGFSNIWNSTLEFVNSSVSGISSVSTFYNEIAAVQSSVNASASTLSTTIGRQNTSTYTTLTANYIAADTRLWNSTLSAVGRQLSSLSSVVAYQTTVNTLSTVLTNQLLSSIAGTYVYINKQDGLIISSISSVYNSTIQPLNSTVLALKPAVYSLISLSTQLSTISYQWISSFVSTSQYYQDVYTFAAIGNVSSSLSTLAQSTNSLTQSYKSFSSNYTTDTSNAKVQYSTLNSTVFGLQYEVNVLTTSSILAGIYDEFMALEYYTSTIIGSTFESVATIESSILYSTQIQTTSTSAGYFNFYVSTLYASTLSTLIPSTIYFTSSMVSTLYSTSYTFLTSSLTSSLTVNFNSTISSYTHLYISTVTGSTESTVLGYLSTPGGELISTISTLDYRALSTFQSTSIGQLGNQSTLFFSTVFMLQSTFYSLQSQASNLLYIQSSFVTSSIIGYNSTLTGSLNSTNTSVYNYTTLTATQTLNDIEQSTNSAYNTFVTGLNASASTAALSSLYTSANMNLAGNNYVATLDLASYRNFNITVYDIINGQSNYLINYQSNTISGLDARSGLITLNISTVGFAYDNNNKQLRFDVYRWGMPTTVWGNVNPYISSSAYTIQYQYNILSNVVYTTLLNVYPQLAVQNPAIMANTGKNVYVSSLQSWSLSNFWRGSPINVGWTNYSFFPYGARGAPPFNPDVSIDVVVGGVTYSSYGPFPLSQSTATVYAPYLTKQTRPVVPTKVNVYIVGLQSQMVTTTFNTLVPGFDDILLTPQNYGTSGNTRWIGGQELIAVTDSNYYPLYGKTPAVVTTRSVLPSPNYTYYGNNLLYQPSNLLNGPYNTIGAGMTSTTMTNGYVAGGNWIIDNSVSNGYLFMKAALTSGLLTTLSAVTALGVSARVTVRAPTNNATVSFTPQITLSSIMAGQSVYNLTVPGCTTATAFLPNLNNTCYLTEYVQYYLFRDTGGADSSSLPLDGAHIVDYNPYTGFGWTLLAGDSGGWKSYPVANAGSYLYPSVAGASVSYQNGNFINTTFAIITNITSSPTIYFNFFLSDSTYISVYFDKNNSNALTVKPSWVGYPYYTSSARTPAYYTLQVVRTTTSLAIYMSTDQGQYLYPNTGLAANFRIPIGSFETPLYTYTVSGATMFIDRVQLTSVGSGTTNVRGFYSYLSDMPTMLSTINYAPSTFVGPVDGSFGADQLVSANIKPLLTANALANVTTIDALNTLAYYNLNSALGNTPLGSNATAGMAITGTLNYNGEAYRSTFTTTANLVQTFKL